MKDNPTFQWLICGYKQGHSNAVHMWQGYTMDPTTMRGRAVGAFLDFRWYWTNRATLDLRLFIANRLMRLAMRLRGEKPTVFGFYDCQLGNRAAKLREDIWLNIVGSGQYEQWKSTLDEIEPDLQELASIAGACSESNL